MTVKYDNFIRELEQLCFKHRVCLDAGYEGYTVLDMGTLEGWAAELDGGAFWQDCPPYDGTEEQ